MRRRDFIRMIVGSAAAWPLMARAQQSDQMRRIGVLMPYAEDDPETSPRLTALREGLLKLGWTEGRNIRFEHRWSASDPEALPKLAREIVDSRPDVILTDTTPPTAAVLHETRTFPVVFVQVGDPVGSGFVASFPRPGGNATGFNNLPPASIRGSGEPVWVVASLNACLRLGPDPRRALWPAVMSTALKRPNTWPHRPTLQT